MTQTTSKKLVSITGLLLIFVGMVGYGILWFLSKKSVLYDHSISALQMAQQQEFSTVKFLLGLVIGALLGWIDIYMAFRCEKAHQKMNLQTIFIVCILGLATLAPFELSRWGYWGSNNLVGLRKWLPFNIAFGTSWFLGSGSMILYHFKAVFSQG